MKEKVKKVLKNRMFIFVCGGLFFSTVSVFAITYFPSNQVTYDNETSGLKATQVQAAIDELYSTCKNNTSGSGGSGNNIYFFYDGFGDGDPGIYKMPISGGYLTKIPVKGSTASSVGPYYEADELLISNNYIYFVSSGGDGDPGIYKMPISGGYLTQILVEGSTASSVGPYDRPENIIIY